MTALEETSEKVNNLNLNITNGYKYKRFAASDV